MGLFSKEEITGRRVQLFAVRDAKAGAFGAPMQFRSEGEAVRSFQDAVNDQNGQIGKYPEDYSLWYLGDYYDADGKIVPDQRCVIQAHQLVAPKVAA